MDTLRTRTVELSDIDPGTWNRLLPGRAEDYDYFRACALAVPDGFTFGARVVEADQRIVALCPTFVTRYPVDLGPVKLPARILGIGSPLSDDCAIGIAPELAAGTRAAALKSLIGADRSSRRPLDFMVLKDVSDRTRAQIGDLAMEAGFAAVATLPRAVLAIDFAALPDYLAGLDANTRRYLRHAERRAANVVIERVTSVSGDMSKELHALYLEQQRNAAVDSGVFDALAPSYFAHVMAAKPDGTLLLTYRVDGVLAGFSFSIFNETALYPKYVGFKQPVGREHRLYFINWLRLLSFCLERGIKRLSAGQNSYRPKVKLGCRLERNWIYFRHPNMVGNLATRAASRFVRFDTMDPDLVALQDEFPQGLYAS